MAIENEVFEYSEGETPTTEREVSDQDLQFGLKNSQCFLGGVLVGIVISVVFVAGVLIF